MKKAAAVLLSAALVAGGMVVTAGPAEAVCGVKNAKSSEAPFWADGKKIDPGKTAPCGSSSFHTGCAATAYWVRTEGYAFGCGSKTIGSSKTGWQVRVVLD